MSQVKVEYVTLETGNDQYQIKMTQKSYDGQFDRRHWYAITNKDGDLLICGKGTNPQRPLTTEDGLAHIAHYAADHQEESK